MSPEEYKRNQKKNSRIDRYVCEIKSIYMYNIYIIVDKMLLT